MSPTIWNDIALAADSITTGIFDERCEAQLRVFRPGRFLQAARALPEGANLAPVFDHVVADSFRRLTERTLYGCTADEREAVLVSLKTMLLLFAARQAERARDIEGMRRLTVAALGQLNDLTAEEQSALLREQCNIFAIGGQTVAALLDSIGQSDCMVGPFRDMLGLRRDIVGLACVPVLFVNERCREGVVAWLHVEAVALGHGHAYPHPDWLALQPMTTAFRQAMDRAWDVALAHVGADHLRTLDANGDGRPVDLRWYLEGLADDSGPPLLRDGSLSAALSTVMAAILLRRRIPDWWAISASVSPSTGNCAFGTFHPVEHVGAKVKGALASGRGVRVLQVHPDNLIEARESALALFRDHPGRVDQVIVAAGSLAETFQRMADHRDRVTKLLAAHPEPHQSKIKRFLEQYLGTATDPVSFGGRDAELRDLDDWLDDAGACPYLLWVAPAGRGKSALLVEWLERLYARNDPSLKIVFVPISIRFKTSQANVALLALAARLARALGQLLPKETSVDLELITDYLRMSPPRGQRLLVVLDGLDEAAGWELTCANLPLKLDRIRIVLSAREKPIETDGAAWLRQLELPARCLRQLALLNRAGLVDVLYQMGFPLDRLSTQVHIIDELYRLTEGDPLLVRLYVEDLWARREAAARLRPEDLRQIEPGYRGYFRRWWKDQEKQWLQSGHDGLKPVAEALLNLLAFALGPLTLDDVLELLESEKVSSRMLRNRLLFDLSRFVIGDGKDVGFSLHHPKLRDYFREELSRREQEHYTERFLVWGARIFGEVKAAKCLPDDVPAYLVHFLGQHLQDANAALEKMLPLLDEHWQKAWQRFDGATHANYLYDVRRVSRLVGIMNRAAAERKEQPPVLGTELWCSLIEASIRSLSGNVDPGLLQALVGEGVWSLTQGLAHLQQLADESGRAKSLIALGEVIPPGYLDELLALARLVEDFGDRSDVLARLVERLPPEQQLGVLQEALSAAQQIEYANPRSQALAELVKRLPAEQALSVTRQIEDAGLRSEALGGLVERLPPDQQLKVLQEALNAARQIELAHRRSRAVADLVERFPLQQALAVARQIEEADLRSEALAGLVERLPPDQQLKVLQEALNAARQTEIAYFRLRALGGLVERLRPDQRLEVLEEAHSAAWQIGNAGLLSEALVALAEGLRPDQRLEVLEEALSAARQIENSGLRSEALAVLVEHLPPDQQMKVLQEALNAARQIEFVSCFRMKALAGLIFWQIEEPRLRSEALAGLVERLPPDQQLGVLHEALSAAQQIKYANFRSRALAGLVERLPLEQALAVARQIEDTGLRSEALARLGQRLLPEQRLGVLEEALSATRRVEDVGDRSDALTRLVERLPPEQALAVARQIEEAGSRSEALAGLVERLPAEQALSVARQIEDAYLRSQALARLVERLPPDDQQLKVFQEALSAARQIEGAYLRSRVLAGLGMLEEALSAASQIEEPNSRWNALARLVERLPPEKRPGVLQEALSAAQRVEIAGFLALTGLVELLPPELALGVARQIKDSSNRSEALAGLVERLPHEQQLGVLQEALSAAQQIENANPRSQALAALVKRLPAEQALSVARQIEDAGLRSEALGELAKRLPHEQQLGVLQEALNAARQIELVYFRSLALAGLVERLPQEQQLGVLQEALCVARQIENFSNRSQALTGLVERLPPEQRLGVLQEALSVARQIGDAYSRTLTLTGLVECLPLEQSLTVADEAVTASLEILGDASLIGMSQDISFISKLRYVPGMLAKRPLPVAARSWARFVQQLPRRGRSDWLKILAACVPLVEHLGGQQALLELANAIFDVRRRWP